MQKKAQSRSQSRSHSRTAPRKKTADLGPPKPGTLRVRQAGKHVAINIRDYNPDLHKPFSTADKEIADAEMHNREATAQAA